MLSCNSGGRFAVNAFSPGRICLRRSITVGDCRVASLFGASAGIGGFSMAFLQVLSISRYGSGEGTR